MTPGIAHPDLPAGDTAALLPVLAAATLATGYLLLAGGQGGRGGRRWSRWRTASFLAGAGLLALALVESLSPYPAGDFRGHMYQHLLLGMLAPLGLVLGAPATLLLRSLPPRRARALTRLLRARPSHLLANPVTALVLSLGGLWLLYATPLYRATTTSGPLHRLVHAHFLAAGCLFAWVIAGPDPAPRRPSVPFRLVVLGVAIAGHAALAQLMYAELLVQIPAPPEQLRGAGELMYYGGDLAEILLALALLTTTPVRRRRRPAAAGYSGAGARLEGSGADPSEAGVPAAGGAGGLPPNRRWRRAYNSQAYHRWRRSKSGQSVSR